MIFGGLPITLYTLVMWATAGTVLLFAQRIFGLQIVQASMFGVPMESTTTSKFFATACVVAVWVVMVAIVSAVFVKQQFEQKRRPTRSPERGQF